jgi:hypothetical protein
MIALRFNERDSLLDLLADQLTAGRLALFLGAGVTMELEKQDDGVWMGLPNWPTLIDRLYEAKGSTRPTEMGLLKAAQEFRQKYTTTQTQYLADVKAALYKGLDLNFSAVRRNDLLGALGALVMSSQRGRIAEVFTFNYDDILERYLEYHGLVAEPIIAPRSWASSADVIVHHPHGFLPSPGSRHVDTSEDIIFDFRSYAQTTGRSDDRWNQKMETVMQSHTCLFVGLSTEDIRIAGLMHESQKKHAYDSGKDGYWGVAFSTKDVDRREWAERGIFLCQLSDYRHDLPSFVFQICQRAADKRRG